MKKELGKWLMDIAKYITTVVIISTLFDEVQGLSLYVGAIFAVLFTLGGGLLLTSTIPIIERYNRMIKKLTSKQ